MVLAQSSPANMKTTLLMSLVSLALAGGSLLAGAAGVPVRTYENSFLLLHLDHHARKDDAIGRAADPVATREAIALLKPDLIQIHAKGRPGLATYPTEVGFMPPKYVRDVQQVWHDVARQAGYLFWIYYNIGRDEEIMRRRPEWNRVDAEGKPRDAMLCYHTGVVDGYLWPMIEELMDRYQPEGFWFDGSAFTVHTCYCATCQKRFKEEQNLELPRRAADPGWDAFKEMHRRIYREFLEDIHGRIKHKDPQCAVVFNGTYGLMMPEEPRFADYLTHDKANWVEVLSAETHFMDAQRKPFDMMTTVWFGNDATFSPKPQVQLEQEMAIIIANGGRYFLWDNPTLDSGLVRSHFEYAGRVVTPFVRARQPWCLGTRRVPDVTLLFSAANLYHTTRAGTRVFPQPYEAILATTDTLDSLQVHYEYTTDHQLEAGVVGTRVLILDDAQALTPRTLAAVRGFVELGGTLLHVGSTAVQPELADLLGVQAAGPFVGSNSPAQVVERDAKGEALLTVHRFGRGQAFFTPRAFQQADEPAAKQAVFGRILARVLPEKDRIVNVAGLPSTVEVGLRRGPQGTVLHLVNRAPGEREMMHREGRAELSRKIIGLPPVPACRVTLRHDRRPRSVTLQPEGTALKGWKYADGRLTFSVPSFPVHQMVVVQD